MKDKNSKRKILHFTLSFCILIFAFYISAQVANAATLYFSPSSGSYEVGKTFSVGVYVSSADQAMNAAFGVITFPQDKLEVTSLSKTGSIFSLWVQEPSFSNALGTINFEGIVLNPGFTGSNGKAITITFRTKAAGNAPLTFSSGSVLKNDGKGTNILTGLGDAAFSLGGAVPITVPEATTPGEAGTPGAPIISSPTHPDPNKWYSLKDAKFNWTLPSDVMAARLLVGKIPQAVPTVTYAPAISSKEITGLEDGILYFHVRLKNNAGWGAISHFRFQIDTQPPEPFSIRFIDTKETDNPQPTVIFDTTDTLSGIDYYKVKIGEGDFFPLSGEAVKNNSYTLPPQAPGKRSILVQAFDRAGNYTTATEEFIIKPIEAPTITKYPEELVEAEALKIEGKTYPEATVTIFLKLENGRGVVSNETKADKQGNFNLIWPDKLKPGIYTFWAEATDTRGAKSGKSSAYSLVVKQEAFIKIGSLIINYLTGIISFLVVGLALFFLGWYLWFRFTRFRKRVKKEVREAELALHKAFELLKEDIQEQIKLLEKTRTRRQLTEEEEKIIQRLKKDLDNAEQLVRKEIEDIEKEIK